MTDIYTLPCAQRANFATAARLLSCLVTESLVQAFYVPVKGLRNESVTGLVVVLNARASANGTDISKELYRTDILAVVPLHNVPVFKPDAKQTERGTPVGLLDPLDMYPCIFTIQTYDFEADTSLLAVWVEQTLSVRYELDMQNTSVCMLTDAVALWDNYARNLGPDDAMRLDVAEELASSVRWQTYSWEHPARPPTFDDPSIVWEQSIVEGHPTHPMHKTRMFLSPIPDIPPGEYDLYNPRVRLASVPRSNLHITGEFERELSPLVTAATKKAPALDVPEDRVLVPIHELQVHHVKAKFPKVEVLPEEYSVPARAQQSIRSMIVPGALVHTSLKLGVGIKLTSAVRTISPASAYLGPRFSSQVVPALSMDRNILTVARELASVVHTNPDGEIAKHCAAIIRECHENGAEERGERLIVCTSLVEKGHEGAPRGMPSVIRVFKLDTEEKRLAWLEEFCKMFFAAFLPPMLLNGVGFEAHPQNTVARYSATEPHRLLGFIIRDFGGIRVHPPTLLASTGVELDAAPNHSIIAEDMDDVFARMYHTVVHNHLQQLIRVLDLHLNGKGWEVVRTTLRDAIKAVDSPNSAALEKAWLGEDAKTVPGKCFMRMRMVGAYRHHLHGPFPNLLHYSGAAAE
ncbi:hypothetical protein PENSPDRAFT_611311, partial [Peniophora sp. CONT]